MILIWASTPETRRATPFDSFHPRDKVSRMDDPEYKYLKIPDHLIPKPGTYRVGWVSLLISITHCWALTVFYPLYREKCRWSYLMEA